ncbi:hypothetical protein L5515_017609 [Caenorhabditis briggsae]|uniref:Uncharacterized protein n=1 Tax=Caenorhabditis briggsae TaxID=6238 RepID=A0AAE9FHA5_CAEBR|nr:hypothetical protein L5515_017609 [Caenorhabditis briggsae]
MEENEPNWKNWKIRPFHVLPNNNIVYHEKEAPRRTEFKKHAEEKRVYSLRLMSGWPPEKGRYTATTHSEYETRLHNTRFLPGHLRPATSYEFLTEEKEMEIRRHFLRIAATYDFPLCQMDYENFTLYVCLNPNWASTNGMPDPNAHLHVQEIFTAKRYPTGLTLLFPPREKDEMVDAVVQEVKSLISPDKSHPLVLSVKENPVDILLRMADIPRYERNLRFYFLAGQAMLRATTYNRDHRASKDMCQLVLGERMEEDDGGSQVKLPKSIMPDEITPAMVDALYIGLLERMISRNVKISHWFVKLNEKVVHHGDPIRPPKNIEEMKELAFRFFNWLKAHKELFFKGSPDDLTKNPMMEIRFWRRGVEPWEEKTIILVTISNRNFNSTFNPHGPKFGNLLFKTTRMKLQTGVSSKDLSTIKELAELEKHKEAMEAVKTNEQNSKAKETGEMDKKEEEQKTDVVDKINVAKTKWENCCLKPDNCCVVKAVRKLTNSER